MLLDNKKKLVELYVDGLIRGNVRNRNKAIIPLVIDWIMNRLASPDSKRMAELTSDLYAHYITRRLRNEIDGELKESEYDEGEFVDQLAQTEQDEFQKGNFHAFQ